MASNGIADRVAIVGMGCTRFGERWDASTDDLLTEAAVDAVAASGVGLDDIDAFWLGTHTSGFSGITLSRPLRLANKPVTRVENLGASRLGNQLADDVLIGELDAEPVGLDLPEPEIEQILGLYRATEVEAIACDGGAVGRDAQQSTETEGDGRRREADGGLPESGEKRAAAGEDAGQRSAREERRAA